MVSASKKTDSQHKIAKYKSTLSGVEVHRWWVGVKPNLFSWIYFVDSDLVFNKTPFLSSILTNLIIFGFNVVEFQHFYNERRETETPI